MIDLVNFASAVVDVANYKPDDVPEVSCTIPTDILSADALQGLVEAILEAETKRALVGIRVDTASFDKLGIPKDVINGGKYNGVPIVITDKVDFDEAEFVFRFRKG